jgi:hypothetical protein
MRPFGVAASNRQIPQQEQPWGWRMKVSLLLGFSGLGFSSLGSIVGAQSLPVASPGSYLSHEGESCADGFGYLAAYRHMMFDGEIRGRARILKEIRLREDYRNHNFSVGRIWSSVTLDVSTCDLDKASATFTANPTSTPARMFSGLVVWPSLGGIPNRLPATFGGRTGALRFPFSSGWVFSGTTDVCLDFVFTGGVLASQNAWTKTSGWYQLDGYGRGWRNPSWMVLYGDGCRDSSWSLGGVVVLDSATHGPGDPRPTFRNKHVLRSQSFGTARARPVVHAVSVRGTTTGVVFPGLTCEKLFLDLSTPTQYLHLIADVRSSFASSPLVMIPFNPLAVGAELWAQAAWRDSQTNRLRLSRASRTAIVGLPRRYRRAALLGTANGTTGPVADPSFNPILLWK